LGAVQQSGAPLIMFYAANLVFCNEIVRGAIVVFMPKK